MGETVLNMEYNLCDATAFIQSVQQNMYYFLHVFISFPHVCL